MDTHNRKLGEKIMSYAQTKKEILFAKKNKNQKLKILNNALILTKIYGLSSFFKLREDIEYLTKWMNEEGN